MKTFTTILFLSTAIPVLFPASSHAFDILWEKTNVEMTGTHIFEEIEASGPLDLNADGITDLVSFRLSTPTGSCPGGATYTLTVEVRSALTGDVQFSHDTSQCGLTFPFHFFYFDAIPADPYKEVLIQAGDLDTYVITGGSASAAEEPPLSGRSLELLQSRPNPSSAGAAIPFTLASPDHATLRIFDVSGRLLRTLVDAELPAGNHEARWDGHDDRGNAVPSGIYFYQLVSRGKAEARKMVVLD